MNVDATNESETVMSTPGVTTYKDLHGGMQSQLPNITRDRLVDYLSLFDKGFERKSQEFYEQRY